MEILGAQEHHLDEDKGVEARLLSLVTTELTMRRLADVIPEAFGLVVASHLPCADKMTFPASFYVANERGAWQSFPIESEPIFVAAIEIAQHVFHNGPRHILKNIADRSGILSAIGNALDEGGSMTALEGSTLDGPRFLGLPASLYAPAHNA